MGQQSLIYAFVARGTVVLAEYTEFTGNFTTIASQCLVKLPASNNKFTYNCDGHTFNYLVEDGFSESRPPSARSAPRFRPLRSIRSDTRWIWRGARSICARSA
jgi:hypothetical protein